MYKVIVCFMFHYHVIQACVVFDFHCLNWYACLQLKVVGLQASRSAVWFLLVLAAVAEYASFDSLCCSYFRCGFGFMTSSSFLGLSLLLSIIPVLSPLSLSASLSACRSYMSFAPVFMFVIVCRHCCAVSFVRIRRSDVDTESSSVSKFWTTQLFVPIFFFSKKHLGCICL